MAKQTRKYADWELSRLQSELEFLNYECGRIGRGHAEQAEAKREAIKAELNRRETAKQQTTEKPQAWIWAEEGRKFMIGHNWYHFQKCELTGELYMEKVEDGHNDYMGLVDRIDSEGFNCYQGYFINKIVEEEIKWSECRFENQPEAAQV